MNKWLALAIAFCFPGEAFAFQGQQEQPGAADYRACQEASEKNDWSGVISSCEKTLAANPVVFGAHYYLGFAYQYTKGWGKCASNFEAFLEKLGDQEAGQQRDIATRQAGLCYGQSGNTTKAIPYLKKAATAKPNDITVQSLLGRSLLRANQEAEAEQVFAKVIQLKPDDATAHYFAASINFRRKELALATERFSKYLELDANGSFAADAHFKIGSSIYFSLDQVEDQASQFPAIKNHLRTFLTAKPNAPQAADAHYILGGIAAQEEDDEAAKSHFESFLQLQPTGPQAEEAQRYLDDLAERAG